MTAVCPECRHDLDVPEHYLGKRWRCPDCRTAFVPPAGGAPASGARHGLLARLLRAIFGRV